MDYALTEPPPSVVAMVLHVLTLLIARQLVGRRGALA